MTDTWDTPGSPKASRHPDTDDDNAEPPRPSKRQRKQALFLSDSDCEPDDRPKTKVTPTVSAMEEDIEALFADAENDKELSFKRIEALDVDAMEREAEARHRRNIPLTPHPGPLSLDANSSNNRNTGDKDGGTDQKKRRKPLLLNENLLLGSTGFPALISEIKYFEAKGKGREVEDLTRLMRIYHLWTHKLYPKTKFRDTVVRIEKLCHAKRMQVALSVWRDEAHGKTRKADGGPRLDSDSEHEQHDTGQNMSYDYISEGPSLVPPSDPDPDTDHDPIGHPPSSRTSSQPPDDFRDNGNALFSAQTSSKYNPGATSSPSTSIKTTTTRKKVVADDDEDDFWRELEAANGLQLWPAAEHVTTQSSTTPKTTPDPTRADKMDVDDDDMWDIVRENEQPDFASVLSFEPPDSAVDQSLAESEMGWDDMYAD